MKKVKDTDFLHISPRIKMLEMKLLTKDDITRMVNAVTDEDAAKIAIDKGYPSFSASNLESLEKALSESSKALFDLLEPHMPNKYFIDFFKIRNDYNNIKAILKGDALGININPLISQNHVYEDIKDNDIGREHARTPVAFRKS